MAKKYGIYEKNMQSFELGQLIRWYISVGGRIPITAHTHMKLKNKSSTKDIRTISHNERMTTETIPSGSMSTAIVTKTGGSSEDDYRKRPPQENPLIRQWMLRKGIDITS